MRKTTRSWTISSVLLATAGATLVAMGLYFVLVRPPLLPEDLRYMALPPAQFDAVRPRLELWLGHVFQVMGGFVFATGVPVRSRPVVYPYRLIAENVAAVTKKVRATLAPV